MTVTFLHTADWQLGKPFASTEDGEKRTLLQHERLNVLSQIAKVVRTTKAEFVLVAGDLFDSPSPTKTNVAAACSAIGAIGVPVLTIPGNHDHGGPGCLWGHDFFLREQTHLAPNLRVLLDANPVELAGAVILPCPLLRRHESADTTAWIRSIGDSMNHFGSKPRIVLAHGSVQGFTSSDADEDDGGSAATNQIDLGRLPSKDVDYVALGDWHGTKNVSEKAWYSGTPEQDRFAKGADYSAGNVLVVSAGRGVKPQVDVVATGRFAWHSHVHEFADDSTLDELEGLMSDRLAKRAGQDLVRLELSGSLGMAAMTRLDQLLESWTARLIRLRLVNRTVVAPTAEEINALATGGSDPLIARVASELKTRAVGMSDEAVTARMALRELYAMSAERGAQL